jgi:N-methylhydantoinase A
VTSVGVCLIHAYANGAHERRVREILHDEYPELHVSLSSEVLPEYREYERAVNTLVDAFVKPSMSRYMSDLREEIGQREGAAPFVVMKSNGGVAGVGQVLDKPISTALSGPAAGALGAATIAGLAGFQKVVTLDAGGTSTDLCLVEDGTPRLTTTGSIGRFPVKLPMIDIVTIGTGGGSIAWRNPEGRLAVGPRSAGARPGPMCYGFGGEAPTITDANLVLGRIPPALIGGAISLDVDRARAGIAALAKELELDASPEHLAAGIIDVANWSQANAIRQLVVRSGLDAGRLALMSFGGSGPAQSGAVMALMGLEATIIPVNPGNLSALGLLAVDWRTDHVVTSVMREDAVDLAAMGVGFGRLEAEADETLARDGVPPEDRRLARAIDARYEGQADEIRVPVPSGAVDDGFLAAALDAFHRAHERLYGFSYRGEQRVEIVNLSVAGFGGIERPVFKKLPEAEPGAAVEPARRRPVYFAETGGFAETPICDRADLLAGARLDGPAVIEEFGATTVLFPGQWLLVDPYGTLILKERAPA